MKPADVLIYSLFVVLVVIVAILFLSPKSAKNKETTDCKIAYIAAVISEKDEEVRKQLAWITFYEPPEVVLNRPECAGAQPNQ